MSRYGYQDMPEGYSDVNPGLVTVELICPECGEHWQEKVCIEDLGHLGYLERVRCGDHYAYVAECECVACYQELMTVGREYEP